MELEEAIKLLNEMKDNCLMVTSGMLKTRYIDSRAGMKAEAIETVIQALRNSIPKEKVKEKIRILKQTPRKEFYNYDAYTFGSIRALEKLLEE